MQTMKKFLVSAVVFLTLSLFSIEAQAQRKIGVLMFSEETRYIEALKGIKDKLREGGFGEPKTTFIVEQAGGNKARAAELVQKFAAEKLDLIITLGTSSTIAVSREIKDVPIVFSMVYDPVEAGIAKDWKSSGNNTTGSNLVNSQVSVIVGMATKAKVITITHLDDLVEKGVLLGVCANSYSVGQLAGEKAVKILKGGKPSSIPNRICKKIRCDSEPEDSPKRPVLDSAQSYEDGNKDNKVN